MLCLGRRCGTSIEVNGPARITVLEIRGEVVRIGIEAEKTTTVLRSELIGRFDMPKPVKAVDDA